MTEDWELITDPEKLFHLQKQGWEIEVKAYETSEWRAWKYKAWDEGWQFRARPAKHKTRTVKYEY